MERSLTGWNMSVSSNTVQEKTSRSEEQSDGRKYERKLQREGGACHRSSERHWSCGRAGDCPRGRECGDRCCLGTGEPGDGPPDRRIGRASTGGSVRRVASGGY